MARIYDNGIYRDATHEELQALAPNPAQEIEAIKEQLSATDYKCLKYAEGEISEQDYEPIKEQRRQLRQRINDLEKLL